MNILWTLKRGMSQAESIRNLEFLLEFFSGPSPFAEEIGGQKRKQ